MIRIRSESCVNQFKENKKERFQALIVITGAMIQIVMAAVFVMIMGYLFGGLWIIMSFAGVVLIVFPIKEIIKQLKSYDVAKKCIATYIAQSDIESLIVDDEGIYGSTANEKFSLTSAQINEVRAYQKASDKKNYVPDFLVTLEITDTFGKKYEFNTFANPVDLKVYIDQLCCK